MKNETKGLFMQIPAAIILVILVIGSFYIKFANISISGKPVTWATPITILIIVVLYFLGIYYGRKSEFPSF